MKVSDFDYDLPPELIAQAPAERRDGARMMVLDRAARAIAQRYMGTRMTLTVCHDPPVRYTVVGDSATFVFAATEPGGPQSIGSGLYVEVNRRTGAVAEFRAGE